MACSSLAVKMWQTMPDVTDTDWLGVVIDGDLVSGAAELAWPVEVPAVAGLVGPVVGLPQAASIPAVARARAKVAAPGTVKTLLGPMNSPRSEEHTSELQSP